MLILTVANISAMQLTRDLEAAGIAATVLHSLGTCAPWPIEAGATAIIAVPHEHQRYIIRANVKTFAARLCKARGETCAALLDIPSTFTLIPASEQ